MSKTSSAHLISCFSVFWLIDWLIDRSHDENQPANHFCFTLSFLFMFFYCLLLLLLFFTRWLGVILSLFYFHHSTSSSVPCPPITTHRHLTWYVCIYDQIVTFGHDLYFLLFSQDYFCLSQIFFFKYTHREKEREKCDVAKCLPLQKMKLWILAKPFSAHYKLIPLYSVPLTDIMLKGLVTGILLVL